MIRCVLTDIEGTTSSIDFVHKVLFPYAKLHLPEFVRANVKDERVTSAISEVQETVLTEESRTISYEGVIEKLLYWIDSDRKHPALKRLQGYIWKAGYEEGAFRGHVYGEVRGIMDKWVKAGIRLAVYSSGSEEAQKLLFRYSEAGDLSGYFSWYFDTSVGHKRESASYHAISKAINIPREDILFLSDITDELDAARESNFKTIQLVRDNTRPGKLHPVAKDFGEVNAMMDL
ncbi:MAG: acireductone synthase [Bacteroidota bacterium]|nr:acireductone synthase [Bacteroidota bacterium]